MLWSVPPEDSRTDIPAAGWIEWHAEQSATRAGEKMYGAFLPVYNECLASYGIYPESRVLTTALRRVPQKKSDHSQ